MRWGMWQGVGEGGVVLGGGGGGREMGEGGLCD